MRRRKPNNVLESAKAEALACNACLSKFLVDLLNDYRHRILASLDSVAPYRLPMITSQLCSLSTVLRERRNTWW